MRRMQTWAERFPELFAPGYWEWGELDVRFSVEQPPDELISNVHVVCRTTGGIVVCSNDLGWRFLSGGAREAGGAVQELVPRGVVGGGGGRPAGPGAVVRGPRRRPPPAPPAPPPPAAPSLVLGGLRRGRRHRAGTDEPRGRRAGDRGAGPASRRGRRLPRGAARRDHGPDRQAGSGNGAGLAARQGSSTALSRHATPATHSAPRVPISAASTPPSAMNAGCTQRELIDHDPTTRAMKPSSVTSIRYVANDGLNAPAATSKTVSAAVSRTNPPIPCGASGNSNSHGARRAPNTSSIQCNPYRRVSRGASHAPVTPPRQEMPRKAP